MINDLNNKLIGFYNDVKYNFNQLKLELNQLQYIYEENQFEFEKLKERNPNKKIHNNNEDLYYEMRKEFNYPSGKYLHGTVYYFINKTAYSGMIRYNKKGEFNVPFGKKDKVNTYWENETTEDIIFPFTIHKAVYDLSSISLNDKKVEYEDGVRRAEWFIDEDMPILKGDDRNYVDNLILVGEGM